MTDIVASPDSTWAASADYSGRLVVWDIDPTSGQWSQRESLVGHSGSIVSMALDPTRDVLITVSSDGTAITWDMSTEAGFGAPISGIGQRWISNRPQTVVPGKLVVAPVRPAPTETSDEIGNAVAAAFVDIATGNVVDSVPVGETFQGTTFGSSVAVSPDASKVAVTYTNGTLVLDTRTREENARIVLENVTEFGDTRPDPVWASVWTPDGSRLLLAAEGKQVDRNDGNLAVVDTETWEVAPTRADIGGSAQSMEASPDGRSIAVGMTIPPVNDAPPGQVKILDAETLEVRRKLLMGSEHYAFDLSYSPDGSKLAVVTATGDLFLFDVGDGTRLNGPEMVHTELAQQVEWLPDGKTVVTSGADGMLTLYDVDRGLVRAQLPGSADLEKAYTYLLSVTGEEITAVTGTSTGRVYPLEPSRWLDYACVVAGRDLSRAEWSSYLPDRPYRRTCTDR